MALEPCDICKVRPRKYDAKLRDYGGSWAFVCSQCFDSYAYKIKGLFTKLKG
jgi:hypothetical protein